MKINEKLYTVYKMSNIFNESYFEINIQRSNIVFNVSFPGHAMYL